MSEDADVTRLMQLIVWVSGERCSPPGNGQVMTAVSGAAKVDLSPESCSFGRKHETLHKCSIVHIIFISLKNRPKKFATPGGRHIDFQYGATITIVLPISPVLLHLGPTFKCLYLCF